MCKCYKSLKDYSSLNNLTQGQVAKFESHLELTFYISSTFPLAQS